MKKIDAAITFTVEGIPVGKGRPRFTRTGHCYTPERTRQHEEFVKLAYTYAAGFRVGKPISGAVELTVTAYFPMPKRLTSRLLAEPESVRHTKRPDGDNVMKLVKDALNGLAYKDDSQVSDEHMRKRYSATPRLEIRIEQVAQFAEDMKL